MNADHKEFLTKNCNRLKYGICHVAECLSRGGHRRGVPVDYSKATCVPYEIFQELEAKSHERWAGEVEK